MGDRNIRVPGLGETMAETRGIYAYTSSDVEQARPAGVYTAEAIARRGEISALIRVARALEFSCTAALTRNVNNNKPKRDKGAPAYRFTIGLNMSMTGHEMDLEKQTRILHIRQSERLYRRGTFNDPAAAS